jgi:hypothetical protein
MDGIVTRGNLTPAQTTFLDRLLEELHKQGTLEEQALFQDINRLTWKPQKYPSDTEEEQNRRKDLEECYYDSHEYTMMLGYTIVGRRLFTTESGFLGLGPRIIEPGDQVWILTNAHTPFLLHPIANSDTFALVEDCFMLDFIRVRCCMSIGV